MGRIPSNSAATAVVRAFCVGIAILGVDVAQPSELRFLAEPLAGQPGFQIRRRSKGAVDGQRFDSRHSLEDETP